MTESEEKYKKFACEAIRRMRKESGLSQEKFAQKIGVYGKTISKYENETRKPEIQIIFDIAKAFDRKIRISFEEENEGIFFE